MTGEPSTRSFASGTGPGAIAPDGSAVDVYAQLPERGEAAIVHAASPAGASILELGSGAGRVTQPLTALGHGVVAVDESPEMLARLRARVPGVRTVCSRIETLDLGERFDVVLLGSHLINVPDDGVLAAFLACVARHLRPDGRLFVERHPIDWFDRVADTSVERNGLQVRLRDVARPAHDLVRATVEYRVADRVWSHTFVTRRLDDVRLRRALHDAGLRFDVVLTDDARWVSARPASAAGAA